MHRSTMEDVQSFCVARSDLFSKEEKDKLKEAIDKALLFLTNYHSADKNLTAAKQTKEKAKAKTCLNGVVRGMERQLKTWDGDNNAVKRIMTKYQQAKCVSIIVS